MTDDPRSGDELRRLLHDAVDDVHPHGTPDDIRRASHEGEHVMSTPAGSRWLPISLAAAAAMVVVIGGTLWLTNGTGTDPEPPVATGPSAQESTTSTSPSPTASTATTQPAENGTGTHKVALPVYYAGDTLAGPRLFREFQRADVCTEQDCAWTAAVDAAVSGAPADADYRSLWPKPASAQWVKYDGSTISVSLAEWDLRDRPSGMSEAEAELAVQQVVYSAQAAVSDGRKPVQILLDGKPVDRVLGVPTSEALAEGDPDRTLAPVQIFSPAEGATVPGTFTVTGQAAAFEANVQWELRQGDTVVEHSFTTARECCTLAPYSFTVKDVAPGQYTLVVHDDDASGEGRVNTDTKDITVE